MGTGATERKGEYRKFFTVMLAASLYTWDITFDLGAYRTVFFHREDQYFVLSVAFLVAMLVVRSEVRERSWLVVAIAPPSLLLLFRLATPVKHPGGALGVVGDILIVANGQFNHRYLTCEDFVIAGLDEPDNCLHQSEQD